jgi:acetylornithine deacetylase/succinyl-diaminopimelate desuccinylase-like protein
VAGAPVHRRAGGGAPVPEVGPASLADPAEYVADPAEFLADLAEYVAIPSVSRDAEPATMLAAAQFLARRLSFADGRVERGPGHPVVRGEWLAAPGRPTVLVYGHYDVQPAGDPARWTSPPFELTSGTGPDGAPVLRGRGVTDDKGPVLLVLAMARALLDREGALPLNVKFLLEGEEEIGSPHLAGYVRDHAAALAADLVISADGAMWRPGTLSLPIGSKGLLALDVTVAGPSRDLHSGRYGGVAANPAHVLVSLLASLRGDDGTIAVAGFDDGIPALSAGRRAEIAAVPFDPDPFLTAAGIPAGFGEPGYSTLERLWERPTLEVNGVSAGSSATIIPSVATAHLSARLVPGQDPAHVLDCLTRHLLSRPTPPGVEVTVVAEPGAVPAYRIAVDHPAIRAGTSALQSISPGSSVLLDVVAGTLPATTMFERELGAKTMFFSFSTSDENLHGPDEFFRVARIGEGMRAWERLWRLLADDLAPGRA